MTIQRTIRNMVLLLACLLVARPSHACLWDYDTLAMEAKGLPDVVQIIVGRFERNPPLYYEMRLARVTQKLRVQPNNLALYDDAGVACDRVGNDDAALKWMALKRARLEKLPRSTSEASDHWYRYYANVGTFRIHRWLKQGADKKRLKEAKQARTEIAKAIKINPNAHFGREKVQLAVMDWLIDPRSSYEDEPSNLADALHYDGETDNVKGLLGLIALGNAWESVDVFRALGSALEMNHQGTVGYLAKLRSAELIDLGKHSQAFTEHGEALKKVMRLESTTSRNPETVRAAFPTLRNAADEWHAHRTEYMMSHLKAGEHPDTYPNFWRDYKEIPAPEIADSISDRMRAASRDPNALIWLVPVVLVGVPGSIWLVIRKLWRTQRKRRQVAS